MHPLRDVWWQLFVNRTDGTLRRRGTDWRFDPRILTREELDRALQGHQSLGIYAVDEAGDSRWVCLDADTEAAGAALASFARLLDHRSTVFEPSRRGAHLWLFCPPTPWVKARAVGLDLARQAGVECEVFPKGSGRNGVRLPLTPHPKTGITYPLIDPATGEVLESDALVALRPAPLPPVKLPRLEVRRQWNGQAPGSYHELMREIGQYTRLREYGLERAVGRCPFHDDQHPSLSILGGFWRCWAGCGEGGLPAFQRLIKRN